MSLCILKSVYLQYISKIQCLCGIMPIDLIILLRYANNSRGSAYFLLFLIILKPFYVR